MGEMRTDFGEEMKEWIKKGVEEAFEKAMEAVRKSLAEWAMESGSTSHLPNEDKGEESEKAEESTHSKEIYSDVSKLLPEMAALHVFDEISERRLVQKAPTSIFQDSPKLVEKKMAGKVDKASEEDSRSREPSSNQVIKSSNTPPTHTSNVDKLDKFGRVENTVNVKSDDLTQLQVSQLAKSGPQMPYESCAKIYVVKTPLPTTHVIISVVLSEELIGNALETYCVCETVEADLVVTYRIHENEYGKLLGKSYDNHKNVISKTQMRDEFPGKDKFTWNKLKGAETLTKENIAEPMRDSRRALLEADVSLPVVRRFIQSLSEQAGGVDVTRGVKPGQQLVKIVSEELVKLMGGEFSELSFAKSGPTIILLAGLQGVGKTTVSAKLAVYLKKRGMSKAQLVLLLKIQPTRRNCATSLSRNGQLRNASMDKNGNGSVSALRNKEYAEAAEIVSSDVDVSSHSTSVTSPTVQLQRALSPKDKGTRSKTVKEITKNIEVHQPLSSNERLEERDFKLAYARHDYLKKSSSCSSSTDLFFDVENQENMRSNTLNSQESGSMLFKKSHRSCSVKSSSSSVTYDGGDEELIISSSGNDADGYAVDYKNKNNQVSEPEGKIMDENMHHIVDEQLIRSLSDDIKEDTVSENDIHYDCRENINSDVDISNYVKSVRSATDSRQNNIIVKSSQFVVKGRDAGVLKYAQDGAQTSTCSEREVNKGYTEDIKSQQLQQRIDMSEGELTEALAIEVSLYYVVAEHGSSINDVGGGYDDLGKGVGYKAQRGNADDGSGLGSLCDSLVGHLTSSHYVFLKKWGRLIYLEAKELQDVKRGIWSSRSSDSGRSTSCPSPIILETSDKASQAKVSKGNKFVYCFCRQKSPFHDGKKDGDDSWSAASASVRDTTCSLRSGDYVILSTEPAHLIVSSGVIMEISCSHVSISFSKRLRLSRRSSLTSGKDLCQEVWRFDRDEIMSSFAVMRFNIVQPFLPYEWNSHLRKMIVDLEAPRFDNECLFTQDPAVSYIRSEDYAFRSAGFKGVYVHLLVEDLQKLLGSYLSTDFAGFGCTIPHKESAVKCCDEVDSVAKPIGAFNCIVRRNNGKLFDCNIDYVGAISAIEDRLRDSDFIDHGAGSPLASKLFIVIIYLWVWLPSGMNVGSPSTLRTRSFFGSAVLLWTGPTHVCQERPKDRRVIGNLTKRAG